MARITMLFVGIILAVFASSQSVSFNCQYVTGEWGTLTNIYYCNAVNALNATSLDEVKVNSISGMHSAGYDSDNVEYLNVYNKGKMSFFPNGLNKFFKNLKGVCVGKMGLQEIHQSDLKDFPELVDLRLYDNQLEIIEEDLFKFNPKLDSIFLNSNKISQIDPNVFDNLPKLSSLYLDSNACISFNAINSESQVQMIIKKVKLQCTNANNSNLTQKVKNLEIESKTLNSTKLNENLQNSKFSNSFQNNLQDLKATVRTISTDEHFIDLKTEITTLKKDADFIKNAISESDQKLSKLIKDTTTTLKDNDAKNDQNFGAIMKFIEKLDKKMEAMHGYLVEIDSVQVKLMNKIDKIESGNDHN
ncbi:hypothetical protein ACKWTF_014511 [Chironomus riparius]